MNIWNRLGRVSEYFTSLHKLQHRSSSVICFGCFRWENFPKNEHLKCLQSLSFFKPCGKKKCIIENLTIYRCISSVQFSLSVVFDSLWPDEPQHARPPSPSPTPGVHPNPCPSSRWCHPTISSSVVPFCTCPQSFSASGFFQMSQLSASGGKSTGVSASTSVPPMNIQGWSPLGWTGWISLQSKGPSWALSNTTVQKHQFFCTQLSL